MPDVGVHLRGEVDLPDLTEDAIYVLVAGKKREDVFKALPEVMNRVKKDVLIWKKEVTENGEYWIY